MSDDSIGARAMPQSVAAELNHRDGFAELNIADQPNMARRAALFQGVKLGAEFAGMRPLRHTLHLDLSTAPPGAKLVYLLRHGQGVHNAWRHAEQAAGRTPTAKRHNQHDPVLTSQGLHDPVLTSQGLADAAAAAELARALPRPQLCVCSPMRRTTQTLLAAFGDAVAAGVPVIAHELCREAFHGRDPSLYDSRLPAAELSSTFPQVDFHTHVLPAEERPAAQAHPGGVGSHPGRVDSQPKMPASIGDPLWWHCVSPYARSADNANGMDEATNPKPYA
jgi:broad specificity phosphatase PhoE